MTRILKSAIAALLSTVLFSCGTESDPGPYKEAGIRIRIEDGGELLTRATPSQIGKPVAGLFNVSVVRNHQSSSETVFEGLCPSSPLTVSPGSYTVWANFGEDVDLAFDSPFYSGSTDVTVIGGQTASAVIPCTVGNCLLSVVFANPELFAEQFSSYGLTVSVGGKSLDISPENVQKSAYFRAGSSVSLSFHAVLSEGGKEVEMQVSDPSLPATFEAGTHIILSLSASEQSSGAVLSVEKVEVKRVSIAASIPMEWLPKPSVDGFSGAKTIECFETAPAPEEAKLEYTAYSPVQDIEFTLELNDPDSGKLNGTYLLSTLSEQTRASLAGIGVLLPALDGVSKSGSVDLRGLVQSLRTDNGKETQNSFGLRVKANGRWSGDSPEQYTMTVKPPVFSVSILPGNVWTKEFTAEEISVSKGDPQRIASDLVYQFSADGGEVWNDFSSGRRQVFGEVPPSKTFKVRACYRGCVCSGNVVEAVLESPAQLPNSDMESWHTQKLGGGSVFLWKSYYDFLPYSSDESDIWWTTNNKRSRDYSVSPVDVTTSPCVSYSESIRHGGNRSALMYTSGHGGGYASTITIVYPQGAFAGSLFIGSYDWTGSSERILTGHPFASRPSALTFWYRYAPKNSDQFKAVVELRSGEDVIATGSFIPALSSTEDRTFVYARADLVYTDETKPATSIFVQFLSTTKTAFSKSDFSVGESISFPVMGSWNAHIGSKLYIDDLNLEYSR